MNISSFGHKVQPSNLSLNFLSEMMMLEQNLHDEI